MPVAGIAFVRQVNLDIGIERIGRIARFHLVVGGVITGAQDNALAGIELSVIARFAGNDAVTFPLSSLMSCTAGSCSEIRRLILRDRFQGRNQGGVADAGRVAVQIAQVSALFVEMWVTGYSV
jgi:hypothetical protein